MPLDYLGGMNGPAPMTMPNAVPGAAQPPGPISSPIAPSMPGPAAPPGLMAPSGPISPAMFPPLEEDPAAAQYWNETQMDGTVILGKKMPDGSRGPILQVIKPQKPKGPGK